MSTDPIDLCASDDDADGAGAKVATGRKKAKRRRLEPLLLPCLGHGVLTPAQLKAVPAHLLAADPASGVPLNMASLLLRLGYVYHYVRDDGNCWIYPLLFERYTPPHATPKWRVNSAKAHGWRIPDPAAEELVAAQEVRDWLFDQHGIQRKGPDYDGERQEGDFFGEYGGKDEWKLLAPHLKVNIILWDVESPTRMCDPNARYLCIDTAGNDRNLTPDQIGVFLSKEPGRTAHYVCSHVRDAHFDCFRPAAA